MMESSDPAARTLRLLALLYSRPSWNGAELADRLGVSPRTLRRDIERLERLDYQVRSRPGPGGYYALGAGTRTPPLMFDDDEVLALVAALRMIEDRLAGGATPTRSAACTPVASGTSSASTPTATTGGSSGST
jgi:predicted DNA-binding transcriptional regulator YafY